MNFFYPTDQQALFTNRERELAELVHYRQNLRAGSVEHVALFGLRRIGKTLLLKEFIRRTLAEERSILPIYMDFSSLSSSPENFVLGYVGQICYWALARGESDPEPFLSPGTLPSAVLQAGASELVPQVVKPPRDFVALPFERGDSVGEPDLSDSFAIERSVQGWDHRLHQIGQRCGRRVGR